MFHFLVSGVALARIAVEFRVDLAERPLQEFDIALQAAGAALPLLFGGAGHETVNILR